MQATARVLELNCQMILLPGIFLISFGDPTTHTSEVKVSKTSESYILFVWLLTLVGSDGTQFLKQANGLDLGKLLDAHMVYYQVCRVLSMLTCLSPMLMGCFLLVGGA